MMTALASIGALLLGLGMIAGAILAVVACVALPFLASGAPRR